MILYFDFAEDALLSNLDQIRASAYVAWEKTFTAAARRLDASESTITYRLSRVKSPIERWFSVHSNGSESLVDRGSSLYTPILSRSYENGTFSIDLKHASIR